MLPLILWGVVVECIWYVHGSDTAIFVFISGAAYELRVRRPIMHERIWIVFIWFVYLLGHFKSMCIFLHRFLEILLSFPFFTSIIWYIIRVPIHFLDKFHMNWISLHHVKYSHWQSRLLHVVSGLNVNFVECCSSIIILKKKCQNLK